MWMRIRSPGLISRSFVVSGLTALKSGFVERAREQRVGRRLRLAARGDVGPVDGLGTAEDVVVARGGVLGPGVLVERAAVDRHRRAVLTGGAAEALELRDVARAVELQLHVGVARMLADVVGRLGIGPHQVVLIGVRLAGLRELRRRLGVAQRQAEPEGRPQLEVPRRADPARRGDQSRLGRQRHQVGDVVARARDVRLELHRGLVVADVLALGVVIGVGAQRGATRAHRLLVALEVRLPAGGIRRPRGRRGAHKRRIRDDRHRREDHYAKSLHRSVLSAIGEAVWPRGSPSHTADAPRHLARRGACGARPGADNIETPSVAGMDPWHHLPSQGRATHHPERRRESSDAYEASGRPRVRRRVGPVGRSR